MGEISIPLFFAALIAVETGWNWLRDTGYQHARDSAASLLAAIPHFLLLSITPVVWVIGYRVVEARVPWTMPLAWWTWPLGVIVMDFATYWVHRYHHALNLTWAIHSVHHSSEQLTLTTGARSSVAEPVVNAATGAYLILIAPALVGLPLAAAGFGYLVKDCWGFAVHTRNVGKLGPLERVLATPSHHRVHHARNAPYAGKNFGFVLIIWDKLLGTFQPELAAVPPRYGIADGPASFNPVVVSFHQLAALWRDARATPRWRDKLRLAYMPAGWRPAAAAAIPRAATPPRPRGLIAIGLVHVAYLALAVAQLTATIADHGAAANLAYLAMVILGTACLGAFFDGDRRWLRLELARAAATAAVLATGAWFGRPLDPVAGALAAVTCAMLGVAAYRRRA